MRECRPPCEYMAFLVLPAIRAQLARVLVEDYNVPQQRVASIMGITNAAVSQYINSKRGAELRFSSVVMEHIRMYAQEMLNRAGKNDDTCPDEAHICAICRLVRSEGPPLKD
ncbi:MAG: transcriptional regulator [Methermicoccaceae archaeon]